MNPSAPRPGSVWYVDFEPVRGRERGRERPALVVSSQFHLAVSNGGLVTVLPITRTDRGWDHHVPIDGGRSQVMTEQLRTVSVQRLRREAPELAPTEDEWRAVRQLLARMLA